MSGKKCHCIFPLTLPNAAQFQQFYVTACCLIMAALWNRAGHHIFVLWFLLSFFLLLFFLALSQPSQIGCLPYFHTWCGASPNLGCRSETCCMQLARDAGRKKSPKIRYLRTITQICRAISSQLRHVLTIEKKLVKQQYLLHMSSQYAELRPTITAEIHWRVWAPQLISTGFAS